MPSANPFESVMCPRGDVANRVPRKVRFGRGGGGVSVRFIAASSEPSSRGVCAKQPSAQTPRGESATQSRQQPRQHPRQQPRLELGECARVSCRRRCGVMWRSSCLACGDEESWTALLSEALLGKGLRCAEERGTGARVR